MLPQHLALISTVPNVSPAELAQVSAALQRQILRDLAPIWSISASIDPFPTFDVVPPGYWPILIVDEAPQPGSHIDSSGHPMAFVEYGPTWSLRASHEAIEMLVDPSGLRTVAGYSPQAEQGRVKFLVEVCDPCQIGCGYTVNGILVFQFLYSGIFQSRRGSERALRLLRENHASTSGSRWRISVLARAGIKELVPDDQHWEMRCL
jgi:hypothetical protein